MGVVFSKAGTMVAIIILGYVLKRIGFLDRSYFKALSKISISITLPCVIIGKFSEFQMDYAFLIFVILGILGNLFMIAVGYIAGAREGKAKQAYNMINFAGFNEGAFTLPFAQNFLGPEGIVAVCLFDAGNSLMCTGGTYALASCVAASGERRGLKTFLKKLFSSVPLDVYLIMLILSMLHISLPGFVTTFASTVGGANAFLAMFVIGIGFEWRMKRSEIRETIISITFRYVLAALAAFCAYRFLPFSLEVRQAMVIAFFAPLSALCPVFTMMIGGDEELSATLNSITIMISTMIITCLLIVFQM